ncbi:hypothetical protein [Schnuerera ultunensis]|nr:hypothetical protein [Schnuerera ultunensis]
MKLKEINERSNSMALKNPINMGNINQMELQNIREIIGAHQNMVTKYDFYSNQCQDQQLKQLFKQSGQDAQTTVTSFINSLK